MIGVTELRNGTVYEDEGNMYIVLSYEHIKMGRGSANIKVKVKNIKNVTNVEIHGHFLRCNVQGSIDELLSVLAKAKPISLISRKPSLEELFLSLYDDGKINDHA
jgi:hypothetical protein